MVEIHREPLSHVGRKYFFWRETLGIPHRVSGLCTIAPRKAALRIELRRFCFRQSDSRSSDLARLRDRRSDLPGEVFAGSIVDRFLEKRPLRTGLSDDCAAFSSRALRIRSSSCLTPRRRKAGSTTDHARCRVRTCDFLRVKQALYH